MGKVRTQIRPVRRLAPALRDRMFALMEEHYAGVRFETFCADLADKDDLFLFHDEDRLVGFSTICCARRDEYGGARLLFSGDTVIHRDYWGRSFLQIAFGQYVLARKLRDPRVPVYWMLISKGYKTYMMMRRNYPESWPRPDAPAPSRIRDVMHRFYAGRFGDAYDPETGLIRVSGGYAVRDGLADPPPRAVDDPDVAHFLALNPQYGNGCELACLAEIRLRDYVAILRKYAPRYLRLVRS